MALYLSGDIHEGIYIYICCFDIVYQNRQMPHHMGQNMAKDKKCPTSRGEIVSRVSEFISY
jgi:hypothetical protein